LGSIDVRSVENDREVREIIGKHVFGTRDPESYELIALRVYKFHDLPEQRKGRLYRCITLEDYKGRGGRICDPDQQFILAYVLAAKIE
jgi:hypothetical protein